MNTISGQIPLLTKEIPNQCMLDNTQYDILAHWLGLVALLVVSLLGTSIPSLTLKFFSDKRHIYSIRKFKLIGVGIIISTALIHMFVAGADLFSGGCVSEFFASYEGWAGVFAIIGFLFAHGLQVVACCTDHLRKNEDKDAAFNYESHLPHDAECDLPHNYDEKSSLVSLEFGIAFHSIIIGMTLGQTSLDFIPLLIAICVHQFFEGLALSSVISEFTFEQKSLKKIMVFFYVVSTPFGCLAGILLRQICI